MPTGGTVTEEDQLEKPLAAKAVHGDDHGIQSWEKPDDTPPKLPVVKEVEKREPEVDEFGLPVKPPRRRLDTEVSDDPESEIVNGKQEGAISRRSSVPNIARGQDHTNGSSESHQEPQQKPTTSTHDLNNDRQPSGTPTIASIPNSHAAAAPWSHQALAPLSEKKEEHDEDDGWQEMPALAQYDLYDDDGRVIGLIPGLLTGGFLHLQ